MKEGRERREINFDITTLALHNPAIASPWGSNSFPSHLFAHCATPGVFVRSWSFLSPRKKLRRKQS
jgi:hypothetical protein